MKYRQRFASIIGICSLLAIFWWCQEKKTPSPSSASATIQESTAQGQTTLNDTTAPQEQKLQVSQRCIGCGRCMRRAPSNFTMSGRHAQVISQENRDSQSVQNAISGCPTQAIELMET